MISQLYDSCKNTVKKIMEAQNYVALTSDIWSSYGYDSVISFIAHFITDKFIRGPCLLRASKFNERNTEDNIALMYSDWLCANRKLNPKLYVVCEMVDPTLLQGLTALVCLALLA